MNDAEQALQYPFGQDVPGLAQVIDIAPSLRWVRMPLPFALDHINLWLIRDEQDGQPGWAVVDCGVAQPVVQQAWERLFEEALDGLPVLRVIVTHMHPDHIGNADWLVQRWSTPERPCRLWISATDFAAATNACRSTTGFGGKPAAAFFASHGLTDPEAVAKVEARSGYYRSMVPAVPAQHRRLMDGQRLVIGPHEWRCIVGHGHAPEHIALFCEDLQVLISGDMVLPRISTNVSVIDLEPEANPLALYLRSLARYRDLPEDTLVLPSHGRPFRGLHTRIDQLEAHHEARLSDVLGACREQPCSAASLLPLLFRRPLDVHTTTFAMGEAIAHLHALWFDGRISRSRREDGVWVFQAMG